ncbi:hypothetical protein [uncultured Corynebacterium sp.]|uniref:hypothetical protein n=1 Tax=uncultured Corynebacterium sp. TaxID=159447 RepID=UPI0025D94E8D|nr:hypothetical protein [uncultured Corynebacterium sp.]
MATHTLQWQYTVLAVAAYSLFGLGLAFYATPSTDAALTNLPGGPGGCRIRNLQDGLVARRGIRCGGICCAVHSTL